MNIAIIGNFYAEYGWEMTFGRAFRDLGWNVFFVDDWKLYYESFPLGKNRYIHHFFWFLGAQLFQKKFIKEITEKKLDILLVFKGWLLMPGTLQEIKKRNPKIVIVNYNPDNPFNTWHHGNSNTWVRESIPLFDAYCIWGKFLEKPLLAAGARRFVYLPCSYDPTISHKVFVSDSERKYFGSDVAFIGSWDEEREEWLRELLNYDLKIWGNAWEKTDSVFRKKWQGREAIENDFAKICVASKIILNFVRKQNGSAHNMRTFEVPACGGFYLSTRTNEQLEILEEGKEAVYFSNAKELREKIDHYLSHEKERKEIAENGFIKITTGENTYMDRAKKIIAIFEEIRKN
jgi:hypothetical protein